MLSRISNGSQVTYNCEQKVVLFSSLSIIVTVKKKQESISKFFDGQAQRLEPKQKKQKNLHNPSDTPAHQMKLNLIKKL